MHDIANIRKEYKRHELDEDSLNNNPILQFGKWFDEAGKAEIVDHNAMTLSTIGLDGYPNGRILLIKGFDEEGFTFFTNYNSTKGQELAKSSRASITFLWKELERQVRIVGDVVKVSEAESDEYYVKRPAGSKLGAWASPQSNEIKDREELERLIEEHTKLKGEDPQHRPPHWGGYRLSPKRFEFWQGRENRLHDRFCYTPDSDRQWKIVRLAP